VAEAGGGALAGALVTLVDSAGRAGAAGLTRDDGTFRLRAAAAGRHHVLVRRIGIAPARSAWVELPASGAASLVVRVPVRPVQLGATRVVASAHCAGRPASSRTAGLFEQARLALEAERATRAERRFGVEIEEREVVYAPEGRVVGEPRRRRRRGPSTAPFVTVAPDSIAHRGYATVERDGVRFHAPDADVLLSEAFLRTHCLEDARGGPGLWAVGVRSARTLPGVGLRGTLWLDSATLALRRFAFRYERLPPTLRDLDATGEVRFETVAEGRWIVRAWWLRLPGAADTTRPPAERARRARHAVHEVGGTVTAVFALGADPADWRIREPGARVLGTVLDRSAGTARRLVRCAAPRCAWRARRWPRAPTTPARSPSTRCPAAATRCASATPRSTRSASLRAARSSCRAPTRCA
jgi:hypothetical protein